MKPKATIRHYLFWFTSSKGSDFKFVFKIPSLPKKEIEEHCKEWAENIIRNGPYSESVIHYGYRRVLMPNRTELLSRYRKACARRTKAQEECAVLAAMLNPRDL